MIPAVAGTRVAEAVLRPRQQLANTIWDAHVLVVVLGGGKELLIKGPVRELLFPGRLQACHLILFPRSVSHPILQNTPSLIPQTGSRAFC